jgi:hypothetical protein
MNLLCRLFGHVAPGYRYSRVTSSYPDGINRWHLTLYGECRRCDENFLVTMTHLPNEFVEKPKTESKGNIYIYYV